VSRRESIMYVINIMSGVRVSSDGCLLLACLRAACEQL
jgi:hypothetical protein